MLGIGALSYFFERCASFFSRMVKTPRGVACPFAPVLTLDRPMRMPLRYTCMTCSGTLTRIMSGPLGETFGFHQYSPGFSEPVGLPAGVPALWKKGFGIACEPATSAMEMAKVVRILMWRGWSGRFVSECVSTGL